MKNSHGETIFILIVENEVGKMEAIYTTLLKEGYEYGFARNREEAIKIMSSKLYDFVIMDFAMPGMTGEEFQSILSIKESKANIIFTYAKSSPSPEIFLRDCQWLGVPFHTEELLNLLQFETQNNGFDF
jgi:DNA-binding response OmpR family regulator